ncbi:hypothetical protein F5Y13DRAFT_45230 [Hypoxylon sp. FL1857]|nr:hypothetical protein F5Y13DRAFT_45230 [Hypoxylon sp. FL1857]
MPYIWSLPQALRLAALFAATASSSFIRPSGLVERADDTCATNFSKCSQAGLPANFCCETGSTCTVLAANTTVLCCPKDSNCDRIGTITCDLSLQDATKNPTAEIKTTVLNGILETCAGQCCPFGYHCDGANCAKDADQSKKPSTKPTSVAPSSTVARTSSSTSKPSTTVAVSGVTTAAPPTKTPTETPATSTADTANTVKIVAGVIGGVVGIVFIVVAVVLIRFRRKQALKKEELQRFDSTSSFGNIISNPVPHANYPSQRLDFLAKSSTTSPSLAMSSPTAVASPPRQHGEEMFEYGGGHGFMPPNSPYSPYARRPDSQMSDVPRSHHASAEITGLRSLTHWKKSANGHAKTNAKDKGKGKAKADEARVLSPAPAPLLTVTPAADDDMQRGRDTRHPSEGESINIFADPLMVGGRPESAATTWSNIQQRADNANGNPNANPGGRLGESPLRNR